MTSARLAAIAIVLFCGTMTALLVRAVYWPEESRLSAIAPQVPIELFLKRLEGTPLDIWEANKITGNLYLNPYGLTLRKDGAKGGEDPRGSHCPAQTGGDGDPNTGGAG